MAQLLSNRGYRASLDLLERRLDGEPLVRQLRFELEALAVLPPRVL